MLFALTTLTYQLLLSLLSSCLSMYTVDIIRVIPYHIDDILSPETSLSIVFYNHSIPLSMIYSER